MCAVQAESDEPGLPCLRHRDQRADHRLESTVDLEEAIGVLRERLLGDAAERVGRGEVCKAGDGEADPADRREQIRGFALISASGGSHS